MNNLFKNQTVLITGHTGFKGSWLSMMLKNLGAEIVGLSNNTITTPSHYEHIKHIFSHDLRANIEEKDTFTSAIEKHNPKFIFHLAAQAIVSTSYKDPHQTFSSNTIGTLNLLEALRLSLSQCTAVLITSDKSYKNLEINRGYHEEDIIGGIDPYSGSKGAAELIISSYAQSFFSPTERIKLGVARAGNVVGGGDWSDNRLIPDAIRAWKSNEILSIRNPKSTRPWQHVLDPLYGYIKLAEHLHEKIIPNNSVFNFGPSINESAKVEDIANYLSNYLESFSWKRESEKEFFESRLLALDSTKANKMLNWKTLLSMDEVIEWTTSWYKNYYSKSGMKISNFSDHQISQYLEKAQND